jgi:hypothetical protein
MVPAQFSNFDIVLSDSLTPSASSVYSLSQDLMRFVFGYFKRVRMSRYEPQYDDEAVTASFMQSYVAENALGSTATWLELPGHPSWTNYFSLGGTTDTVTVGSNKFRCGLLLPN